MQTPRSVQKEREELRGSRDSPAARGERAGCPPAAHGGLTVGQRFRLRDCLATSLSSLSSAMVRQMLSP